MALSASNTYLFGKPEWGEKENLWVSLLGNHQIGQTMQTQIFTNKIHNLSTFIPESSTGMQGDVPVDTAKLWNRGW